MLAKWFRKYNEATSQTKYFILTCVFYGLTVIISTAYCFARLDFVRSYQTPLSQEKVTALINKTHD